MASSATRDGAYTQVPIPDDEDDTAAEKEEMEHFDKEQMCSDHAGLFPPLKRTREREAAGREPPIPINSLRIWGRSIMKWFIPALINATCTFLSMWMLHIGTYYYVHEMVQFTENYEQKKGVDHNLHEDLKMSTGIGVEDISFGSLNDPLEEVLGFQEVSLKTLDMIAAFFPMLFIMLACYMDELGTWSKIMFCNAFLALGKGLFGIFSVIPDSKGWAACQERLTANGIAWMSKEHSFADIFHLEVHGIEGTGQRLRWCADMMWSGHTYFTCLYALGLCELVTLATRQWSSRKRMLALFLVVFITVAEQIIEVYAVLLNRFHYTMDIVMAILITFLIYTNGMMCGITKKWVRCLTVNPQTNSGWTEEEKKLVKRKAKEFTKANPELAKLGTVVVDVAVLKSDGEIVMPLCCPCLGLNLTQHVFVDTDIQDFLLTADREMKESVSRDMRLSKRRLFGTDSKPGHMRGHCSAASWV